MGAAVITTYPLKKWLSATLRAALLFLLASIWLSESALAGDSHPGVSIRGGSSPQGFWLFRPARQDDRCDPSPVVIFLHGYTAVDPDRYRAWIDHIVEAGNIVIYPEYQTSNPVGTPWADMVPNALAGVRQAIATLEQEGACADLERIGVVGHSLGGVLASNYAARAEATGLPVPRFLLMVAPGGCTGCAPVGPEGGVPLPTSIDLPAGTLVSVMVGDADSVVGDAAARAIWGLLTASQRQTARYVLVGSSVDAVPPLVADHSFAETGGPTGQLDELDRSGTWRVFDMLANCAFRGVGCAEFTTDAQENEEAGTAPLVIADLPVPLPTAEPVP